MKKWILGVTFASLFTLGALQALPAQAKSIAAQDAALRDKIQKEMYKTQETLAQIHDSIQKTTQTMKTLEVDLKTLYKKEIFLKKQLSENIQKHHLAMANLARLERQPLRALLTYDMLKVQPQRQPILAISRKALNHRIEENRAKLMALLKLTHEKEQHQERLRQTTIQLESHQKDFATLQKKQNKLLSLPPKERRRLEKRSQQIAKKGDIQKLLALTNALTGFLGPATSKPETKHPLPLDGIVMAAFHQRHPKTGIASNGLKIKGIAGQPVHAAKSGRVLYAGPFKGFRSLVIMEHEKGVHSLYGGMGQHHYPVGAFVPAQKALGTLPNQDDPTLYLEVRKNGTPIDPQKWLKKN